MFLFLHGFKEKKLMNHFGDIFYKKGKKAVTETMKEEKQKPSDNELKAAVCEILKQVDFNTVRMRSCLFVTVTNRNCF